MIDVVDCDADYSANLELEEIMLEQEFVTSWSAFHEEIRGSFLTESDRAKERNFCPHPPIQVNSTHPLNRLYFER